ncbi:MAG: carboxymethylenebutenolidase [Candidatus Tectimicrobiota bacterium]|nr:MAG: carboxymethylenebutenolidase [Candidatus Tectomicrobia bacterium]
MPARTQSLPVDGQPMDVYLSAPEGPGPFPAVVVIQHAGGVDPFIRSICDRLAAAGYLAAAPDLYHRLPPHLEPSARRQQLKDAEIIADVNATVDFLRQDPLADGARLGILGFCMGGRVVYLMATVNPHFKAAVAYYGGNLMVPWGEGAEAPFARTRYLHCPLLFHFGEEDPNPSLADMEKLDAELTRYDKPHEFYVYPRAGHAFMDFTNPQRYRKEAAEASWPRTLDFLARHLGAA